MKELFTAFGPYNLRARLSVGIILIAPLILELYLLISEMQKMQLDLYEKNKEKWGEMKPNDAKSHMLYMIEEIGECISII